MLNVSSKSIELCNKVTRISQHFHLQVFLNQTFLYALFQISFRGAFQDCGKTFEIKLLQKLLQMLPALEDSSILNV